MTSVFLQQDTHISEYASSSYPQGVTSPTQHHHQDKRGSLTYSSYTGVMLKLGKIEITTCGMLESYSVQLFFFFSSIAMISFFVPQQQFRNFALINLGKEYLHRQTLAKTDSTAAEKVLNH